MTICTLVLFPNCARVCAAAKWFVSPTIAEQIRGAFSKALPAKIATISDWEASMKRGRGRKEEKEVVSSGTAAATATATTTKRPLADVMADIKTEWSKCTYVPLVLRN